MADPYAAADSMIGRLVASADRAILSAADAQRVHDMMVRADKELSVKLARELRIPGERFTEIRLRAAQAQIRLVLKRVQAQLTKGLAKGGKEFLRAGLQDSVDLLAGLEEKFMGAPVQVDIDRVGRLDSMAAEQNGSLLAQHQVSVERYGDHMIGKYQNEIMQGMMQGETAFQIVERLTGGATERIGLFGRQEYWARRIVRTEMSYAYNSGNFAAIRGASAQFDDLGKKILATFDNRTAFDSVYVHGQIRKIDEPFMDGAGRVYDHPPARPNDRETVIPWRMQWPNTPYTRTRPPAEVGKVVIKADPKYLRPTGARRRIAQDEVAQSIRRERKQAAIWRKEAREGYAI